jgi:hypothetical protein
VFGFDNRGNGAVFLAIFTSETIGIKNTAAFTSESQ